VTFWPDPQVFSSEGTEFHVRTVLERLQTMAFLNKGLEIQFVDERPDREQQKVTYLYRGGIVDFVKHLNASKEALFSKVAAYAAAEDDQEIEIALQWNTGYYESIHGYANGISTTEGGMHVEGFKTALTSVGGEQVRPRPQRAEGEGRQPRRRGHPGRAHRDHRRAPA
jgi:DNA gyrase subunit B